MIMKIDQNNFPQKQMKHFLYADFITDFSRLSKTKEYLVIYHQTSQLMELNRLISNGWNLRVVYG